MISFRVSNGEHDAILAAAALRGLTVSQFIRRAIDDALRPPFLLPLDRTITVGPVSAPPPKED